MYNFSINIKKTDRKKTVSFQVERGLVKVLVPKHLDKSKLEDLLKKAEEEADQSEITDQVKYLADQKVQVLRSIN